MNKKLEFVLFGLLIIIFIVAVFQFRIINLESGEKAVIYTSPFNNRPGGSSRADLNDGLKGVYGDEDVLIEQYDGQWKGKHIIVYDVSKYDVEYLGQSFTGDHYFLCKVFTNRLGKAEDKEEPIRTERTITYIGYDDGDLNSDRRAAIIWETMKTTYSDSKEYFDGFIIEP